MKIKELKEYLNTLPPELDNFDIVYSKTKILSESDGTWARFISKQHCTNRRHSWICRP